MKRLYWPCWSISLFYLLTGQLVGQSANMLALTGSDTRILSDIEFKEEVLVRMAKEALAVHRPFMYRLILSTSVDRFIDWSAVDREWSFEFWRSKCERAIKEPRRIAELLAIGGDAVLRIRDGMRYQEIILSGSSPLEVKIRGGSVRIMHVDLFAEQKIARFYMHFPPTIEKSIVESMFSDLVTRIKGWSIRLIGTPTGWFPNEGQSASCHWESHLPPSNRAAAVPGSIECSNAVPKYGICTLYNSYRTSKP